MADYVDQQLGNYRLRRLLGRGGAGDVYLGEHIHLETLAAIKVLHIQMGSNEIDDFRREARIIAHLIHPNIVRVLDFGIESNMPYLVMDYAPKGTLRQCYEKGTRLSLTTVVTYVKQVASALQYAHDRKVIHRDVKPENLLLGINNQVLLSDFGISAIEQNTNVLITQQRLGSDPAGTIYYMAPEQIEGNPHPASDQYALGVVIYEWLCGSRPFQGEVFSVLYKQVHVLPPSLREQIPSLSPLVEQVVLRALAKEPRQRFATIWEFAEALEQASEAQQTATLSAWPLPAAPAGDPVPAQEVAVTQENATLPALPISEESGQHPIVVQQEIDSSPGGKQKSFYASTTLAEDTRAATILPGRAPKPLSAAPIQRDKGPVRAVLLVGLAFIIVVGGVAFLLSSLNNRGNATSPANAQATATARAHVTTTAGFLATATAAANAYNSATTGGVMLGFNAQHTRFNPFEKVLNHENVSQLVQAWKVSSGGRIYSVPTVANGIVYVTAGGPTSNEGKMFALDAGMGHPTWTNSAGTLYFGAGPTVANGVVYIGSDNNLYAFDARGGAINWTATVGGRIGSSPTLVNDVIYLGADDGKLYAFNVFDGKSLWSVSTGGAIRSSPAVANVSGNEVVYVGSDDHNLYAINAGSHTIRWTTLTGGAVRSAPAVVNGIVYIGSADHKLYAIKADSGAVLWSALTGDSIFSSPAVANGVVYIGSSDGKLYAFNASGCGSASCSPLWIASTGSSILSSPTVANGVVYIGSNDHNLYAFNASGCGSTSCSPLWKGLTGGIVRSSPVVANGFVYVGSDDGNIYAFHLPGTTP